MLHREMPSVLSGSRVCCPSTGSNLRKETEAGEAKPRSREPEENYFLCGSSPVGIRWEGEEDLPAEVSMEMEAHRSRPEDRSEEG